MRVFLVACLAFLALHGKAMAADRWAVQQPSQLGFQAEMAGTAFTGSFQKWTADIRFDPKALKTSSVRVVIDMASARTADADRDASLPTADWFAVKTHPQAVFVSKDIRQTGPRSYVAHGGLSIRGVAKPVILPFTLDITGDTAKMTGAVTIDRTMFGVGQGQWAQADPVKKQVNVTVNLTARRTKP